MRGSDRVRVRDWVVLGVGIGSGFWVGSGNGVGSGVEVGIHAYTVPFRRVNINSFWPFLASFQCYFGMIYSSKYSTRRFPFVCSLKGAWPIHKRRTVQVCIELGLEIGLRVGSV